MNPLGLLTLTEQNTHLVREIRKVFGPAGNKLDTMTVCEVVLHDSKERVASTLKGNQPSWNEYSKGFP